MTTPSEVADLVERKRRNNELRQELAVVAILRKRAERRYNELRAELGETLTPGDHISANILDDKGEPTGPSIGKLTMTNPEERPTVGTACHVCGSFYDAPLFTAWVKDKWPNQVVEVVKPAHRKLILSDPSLTKVDDQTTVDGNGVIVPEIRWLRERPQVRMNPVTEKNFETMWKAWQRGQLDVSAFTVRALAGVAHPDAQPEKGERYEQGLAP